MFGRFGREARRVVELAEGHARALSCPAVGPEHLLLALLAVDDRGTFRSAGLGFDDLRALLASAAPDEAATPPPGHLPLRLREVLRSAFRHAAILGDPEVTPLHLALALVDEPPGEVSAVARRLGGDVEAARAAVLAGLSGTGPDEATTVVELDRHRPVAAAAGAREARVSAAP